MGKDWTKEELQQASKAMMANGQMGYEESVRDAHKLNRLLGFLRKCAILAKPFFIAEIVILRWRIDEGS